MASPRTLLIIDIQRDYFPGGAYPLVEPEAAAEAARRVLDSFRDAGDPVIHMKHVWDAPEAEFMRPGTDGIEIHPTVAPADGELVLEKTSPNAFVETPLEEELRQRDPGQRSSAMRVGAENSRSACWSGGWLAGAAVSTARCTAGLLVVGERPEVAHGARTGGRTGVR